MHACMHTCPCLSLACSPCRYSASSPDEGALVYGAKHFGVEFLGQTPTGVEISVLGRRVQVEVLASVEFSSKRKRSSMLCEFIYPASSFPSSTSSAQEVGSKTPRKEGGEQDEREEGQGNGGEDHRDSRRRAKGSSESEGEGREDERTSDAGEDEDGGDKRGREQRGKRKKKKKKDTRDSRHDSASRREREKKTEDHRKDGQLDCEEEPQRKIVLLTKGADSVILPLLKEKGPLEEQMIRTMEEYAEDGLRTLCIAKREVEESEFLKWFAEYEKAERETVDRQLKIEE